MTLVIRGSNRPFLELNCLCIRFRRRKAFDSIGWLDEYGKEWKLGEKNE